MENTDREIQRLWRIHKTVKEMMLARNYILAIDEQDLTLDEFKNNFVRGGQIERASLNLLVENRNDSGDQLLVYFTDEESVGIKPIKKICESMISQCIMKAILIYQKSITPSANKVVTEMQPKYHIELFQEAELLVNITKHILVPEHVVLFPQQKKELLEKYRLKDSQLPRIQPQDPVARFFGLKRGQVVKITRKSETAGRYVTYRLCW